MTSQYALTSPSTFSGGLTLTNGQLALTAASTGAVGAVTSGALGTGTFNWNGGYVRTSTSSGRTVSNAMTIGGNIGLGDNVTIGNASQTLTLNGAATLASTLPTYTFTVAASAGTVAPVNFAGAIAETTAGTGITVAAGGTAGGTATAGQLHRPPPERRGHAGPRQRRQQLQRRHDAQQRGHRHQQHRRAGHRADQPQRRGLPGHELLRRHAQQRREHRRQRDPGAVHARHGHRDPGRAGHARRHGGDPDPLHRRHHRRHAGDLRQGHRGRGQRQRRQRGALGQFGQRRRPHLQRGEHLHRPNGHPQRHAGRHRHGGRGDDREHVNRVRGDVLTRVLGEHGVDQALFERIYERHIKNPQSFWTPYPLPSIALDDPQAERTYLLNSWGGGSQALTALRAPRWFGHYGKAEGLRHLMQCWVEALTR